jgi:hypothetical protein
LKITTHIFHSSQLTCVFLNQLEVGFIVVFHCGHIISPFLVCGYEIDVSCGIEMNESLRKICGFCGWWQARKLDFEGVRVEWMKETLEREIYLEFEVSSNSLFGLGGYHGLRFNLAKCLSRSHCLHSSKVIS